MSIITVHDAIAAIAAASLAVGLFAAAAGYTLATIVELRRARAGRDRLHRTLWAIDDLSRRLRETADRWEGEEIAVVLDEITETSRPHPLDGVRLGLRARLAAARMRRRDKDGGAR